MLAMALTTAASAQASQERQERLPNGDAARGRALVADRQRGLCLLCHRAPILEDDDVVERHRRHLPEPDDVLRK